MKLKKTIGLFVLLLVILSASSVFADQPDLELNGWTTTSVTEAGEVGAISAIVLNKRGMEAGEFRVTFDISPSSYKIVEGGLSQKYEGLGPGGQLMSTIKVVLQEKTDYTIKIIVDPDDSVAETNEQNNAGIAKISVGGEVITAPPRPVPPPALPEELVEKYPLPLVYKKYPVPPPVPVQEYESCIEQLKALKEKINQYDQAGLEVPVEFWNDYKALDAQCQSLRPIGPPVALVEREEVCVGCRRDASCLQFGIRLVENGVPVYCDIDSFLKPQKQVGESAQNNYECLSNTAADSRCVSIEERIQAVEQELKEQRTLIQKILDFFKNIFGG
ncbi:MAG TPA: CARDB domain-containing protein [Candidatus Nanoarchaeia archaeon]|nr:CARDB domain-containing protein [Candidatus Nanoarchaeia archaeon]